MAQWKRAGPITQRSVDRNHALLSLLLFYHFGASVQWKQEIPSGNYKVTMLTEINRLRPQKTCTKLTKDLAKRSDGFVTHTVL